MKPLLTTLLLFLCLSCMAQPEPRQIISPAAVLNEPRLVKTDTGVKLYSIGDFMNIMGTVLVNRLLEEGIYRQVVLMTKFKNDSTVARNRADSLHQSDSARIDTALNTSKTVMVNKASKSGLDSVMTKTDTITNRTGRRGDSIVAALRTKMDTAGQAARDLAMTANTAARHAHVNKTALDAVSGINTGNQALLDSMRSFDPSGNQIRQVMRRYSFTVTPTTGIAYSINLSPYGLTTLYYYTVTAMKNTGVLSAKAKVSFRSKSASAIVVDISGGAVEALLTDMTGITLDVYIEGY